MRTNIKAVFVLLFANRTKNTTSGRLTLGGNCRDGSLETRSYVSYAMTKGWKISAVRPGRGASGALRQEIFLVAIPDKGEALRAVQACLPDAELKVDSEVTSDILEKYEVNNGEMFVVPEGS